MDQNIVLQKVITKAVWGILFIFTILATSCSAKMCPDYSNSEGKNNHSEVAESNEHKLHRIQSPYTKKYKAHISKKIPEKKYSDLF